jgi:hypothetical protein
MYRGVLSGQDRTGNAIPMKCYNGRVRAAVSDGHHHRQRVLPEGVSVDHNMATDTGIAGGG